MQRRETFCLCSFDLPVGFFAPVEVPKLYIPVSHIDSFLRAGMGDWGVCATVSSCVRCVTICRRVGAHIRDCDGRCDPAVAPAGYQHRSSGWRVSPLLPQWSIRGRVSNSRYGVAQCGLWLFVNDMARRDMFDTAYYYFECNTVLFSMVFSIRRCQTVLSIMRNTIWYNTYGM